MTNPLVSVCIPTYKGAGNIGATIDSVMNQTYRNFELWILDDNSPDNTKEVVSHYDDHRIKYVRNEKNLGPQENWNKCIELASGKYFKLLPHDDLLEPDCLESQVSLLEADKISEIALVFGSRKILDPDGQIFMTRGLPGGRAGRIDGKKLVRLCVRAGTNLIGEPGNGLFRREIAVKVGGYDATYPYLVDLDYWTRILLHGDAFYLAKPTSSFRITQGSWSVAIGAKQDHDFMGFVDKFYQDGNYGITFIDRIVCNTKARINTMGRALIYLFLFKKKAC